MAKFASKVFYYIQRPVTFRLHSLKRQGLRKGEVSINLPVSVNMGFPYYQTNRLLWLAVEAQSFGGGGIETKLDIGCLV